MIEKLVRKNIINLKPYSSARDSHMNGTLMDANENSLGSVINDKQKLQLNRYPDPRQNKLRIELSKYLGVNKEKLFFGVGSDEIIDLLIRIFCEPGKDSVIIPQPTYGMYQVACDINNIEVINVSLNRLYQLNIEWIFDSIRANTKMIFLCSPNNPTGNALSKNSVRKILKRFNGIVVADEAYIDFCEDKSLLSELEKNKNLVILRTFSKAWGLAGIRCGYSVANEFVTEMLFKIKAPYNMNKLSSNSVLKALRNVDKKNRFVEKLNLEKSKMVKELKNIQGVSRIIKSDANFITFKIDNAKSVFNNLAEKGIIIRDRSGQFNLENCLRVSIGSPGENKIFIKKLKEII